MKHPAPRALLLTLTWISLLLVWACLANPLIAFAQQNKSQSDTNQNQTNQNVPSAQSGQSTAEQPQQKDSDADADAANANGGKDKASRSADDKAKKDEPPDDPSMVRLKITVASAESNRPIGNASVYIRFPDGYTRLMHREKLSEMNFKTNLDGSVKVPNVPKGRVLVQVVASGWHTYGKWYDVDRDGMQIDVKLDKPPKWY